MRSRSTKKGGHATPPPEPGFHSPFRDLVHAAAEQLAAAGKAKRKQRAAAVPSAPASAAAQRPREIPEITDEEAFAQATAGVAPLSRPASAVRRAFTPDLERIAARRNDLEELGALDFDIAFHDHYVRARAAGVSRETLAQLEKGMFAVSAHIDLHGMVLDDARVSVDEFLREQQRRGHRCVLIVTGKGRNSPRQQGVLRQKVPEWLARGPSARRILAFVTARPCDGGLGALYVLMRRGSSRKNRIDVELGGVGGLES
ncbi:MAG TPA: Smr/MutS family protein [Candidatus Limnocylindrales bacterium]|nr:Smr/MutS family protein [Candidatus Limnocylindrales bacterium]